MSSVAGGELLQHANADITLSSGRKGEEPGVALIKSEFVIPHCKPSQSQNEKEPEEEKDEEESANPPPRKRRRGQNKNRPRPVRIHFGDMLCPSLHDVRGADDKPTCLFGEKCRYTHNVVDFMANKLPDIGDSCHVFNTFGHCQYGVACRYAGCHVNQEFFNIVREGVEGHRGLGRNTVNLLSKHLQENLRKKRIKFVLSENYLEKIGKNQKDRNTGRESVTCDGGGAIGGGVISDGGGVISDGGAIGGGVISDGGGAIGGGVISDGDGAIGGGVISDGGAIGGGVISDGDGAVGGGVISDGGAIGRGVISDGGGAIGGGVISDGGVCVVSDGGGGGVISDDGGAIGGGVISDGGGGGVISDGGGVIGGGMISDGGVCVVSDGGGGGDKGVCSGREGYGEAIVDKGEIRPSKRDKRKLDFSGKLYLAPLTTTGNLPFRRICKEFGADVTCGEMAMCTNLLQGHLSEWALLKRHECEDVFGVQLCGSHADTMTRCAELINSHTTVDFVDVNVGCPIDLVFKKGAGSALMGRHTRFEQIVRGMDEVLDCPITVKMRAGIHKKNWNAHKLVPKLKEWGVSMVTVHGRSREQRYTKAADWGYINTCVQAASPMPLFGNGDILSFEDYNCFVEKSQTAGVMIARGALIKPWIFTEIKEQRHWDISSSERLDIIRRYANYGLEHWGSDTQGVENTRRFLLEWLSFLYRYIPLGLLEHVPQHINQRPPSFRGRDDLETLMASSNSQDWVKLSEMVLGPAPESFAFVPKHKANAYS